MMNMKEFKLMKLTVIALLISTSITLVAAGVWQHLGTRTASYNLDFDRIVVTEKGTYAKLKINVRGNLNMHSARVNYANGTSQQLKLKHSFRAGTDSRIIDLNGNKRRIKSIDFWYDTNNRSRKRAKILVFGRR